MATTDRPTLLAENFDEHELAVLADGVMRAQQTAADYSDDPDYYDPALHVLGSDISTALQIVRKR